MDNKTIIQFENILKVFPGVVALNSVSLSLKKGEIHGLVGKNGAGKSTFVDIMYGAKRCDSGIGIINIDGIEKQIDLTSFNPKKARDLGIYLVPQEPPFATDLTIEENFFMQNPIMKKGKLDRLSMCKEVKKALLRFGLNFNPNMRISDISMEDRHLVYTALVTELFDSRIILLDEVTSALRRAKTERLFEYLNQIKKDKVIVLITHRIPEILELCDTVSVFRDGDKIITDSVKNFDGKQLSDLIVGESVEIPKFEDKYYCNYSKDIKNILELKHFTMAPYFNDINLEVKEGEILGVTGLFESGATQLFRAISGIMVPDSGNMKIRDEIHRNYTPSALIGKKVVYGTNDRLKEGSFNDLSILDNVNVSIWSDLIRNHRIDLKEEIKVYNRFYKEYNIKSTNFNHKIMTLSGGNQQKVILARLSALNPQILILDEPTKGIDVGAKYEILKLLRINLTGENSKNSLIINSSSIEELMLVCDRILVMVNGQIVKEFTKDKFNEKSIFRAIQGV